MRKVQLVEVSKLRHIEDYGRKRVQWLFEKISQENIWTVPLKIDDKYGLVMDGQHRMEVALKMGLKYVPAIIYSYDEVKVWSLRDNHEVTPELIISKSLSNNIYPYKTAKHEFPDSGEVTCNFKINELLG